MKKWSFFFYFSILYSCNILSSLDSELLTSIRRGKLAGVQKLLDAGASPDATDSAGRTGLHLASSFRFARNRQNFMKLLIERGANVNAIALNGCTPLMAACNRRKADCVDLLLQGGANSNIRTISGTTALMVSSVRGDPDSIKLLLDAGADHSIIALNGVSALMSASGISSLESVGLLLDIGADPNTCLTNGVSALMLASSRGLKDNVELLLDKGADPNLSDQNGGTALMVACMCKYTNIVDLLLKAGADVHAIGPQGTPVLHYAHDSGCINLLIEYGADIHERNFTRSWAFYSTFLYHGVDIPHDRQGNFLQRLKKAKLQKKQAKYHESLTSLIDEKWVRKFGVPEDIIHLLATFIGESQLVNVILNRGGKGA